MKTIAVGLREFRTGFSEYMRRVQEQEMKVVILRHGKPVCVVSPASSPEFVLEAHTEKISLARMQIADGQSHSFIHVCHLLGYDQSEIRDGLF